MLKGTASIDYTEHLITRFTEDAFKDVLYSNPGSHPLGMTLAV